MLRPQEKNRVKKRIRINSLQAAICNVALFKSMKDKDFRDSIFISYSEEGVILESYSEHEWNRAHDYILNFLANKKIELLTDGYEKEIYENLINKGLKEVTRRIREREDECPYINIIHYQKLRKSCEYMDKERYADPLKDWEKKSKKNPNFAFLIVEPKSRFDEVKRGLLEHIMNEPVRLDYVSLEPLYFMYLLFYSPLKDKLRDNYRRRQIEFGIEKQEDQHGIRAINFTNMDLNEYSYTFVRAQSIITKSGVGMEVITASEIRQEAKNAKLYCKQNPVELVQVELAELEAEYGKNFLMIPYRYDEEEKYRALIEKYTNTRYSKEQIQSRLLAHKFCLHEEIQPLGQLHSSQHYSAYRGCIKGCPFMVHEYPAAGLDMDSFIMYMDQLQLYYCTYIIRYYGVAIKYGTGKEVLSYGLVFDYHRCSLETMRGCDMILDGMQVASMVLQLLYLVNFLHSHQQPRCLGPVRMSQLYWPMAVVLPYLANAGIEPAFTIENDVKEVGLLMRQLLGEEKDEDLDSLLGKMVATNKYDRPTVKKCIADLEQLLCL